MLCNKLYLHRHNLICQYIHWNVWKDNRGQVSESWLVHKPAAPTTLGNVVVTYDLPILTDRRLKHNKPDLIVWDKSERTALIIDVVVPMDRNVVNKIAEKLTNYRDLEIELQKYLNLKDIKTIPIIVGALGTTCVGLQWYLTTISPHLKFPVIQKTALLGSALAL